MRYSDCTPGSIVAIGKTHLFVRGRYLPVSAGGTHPDAGMVLCCPDLRFPNAENVRLDPRGLTLVRAESW